MTSKKTVKTLRGAAKGDIAARLKEVREQLRLSQKKMGGHFDMKENAYGKTETGYTAPSLKLLYMLATGFNVSLDWLVCGRGTMFYDDPEKVTKSGELKPEIDEMLELIKKLPLAQHLILGYFQKFKLNYSEVIQKELGKKTHATGDVNTN